MRYRFFKIFFQPLKKGEDDKKNKNGEVGSGRVIPLRQVNFLLFGLHKNLTTH